MCLNLVTSIKNEKLPKDEYYTGWKCINVDKQSNTFQSLYNCNRHFDKWLRCRLPLSETLGSGFDEYPAGFHIFITREGARNWSSYDKVIKVRYRRVVARGIQGGYKCIVAKEMYVESPK